MCSIPATPIGLSFPSSTGTFLGQTVPSGSRLGIVCETQISEMAKQHSVTANRKHFSLAFIRNWARGNECEPVSWFTSWLISPFSLEHQGTAPNAAAQRQQSSACPTFKLKFNRMNRRISRARRWHYLDHPIGTDQHGCRNLVGDLYPVSCGGSCDERIMQCYHINMPFVS